jgi:hypothetical protein
LDNEIRRPFFTDEEKVDLISRLRDRATNLSIDQVLRTYEKRADIPSRRNIFRILNPDYNGKINTETAEKINCLLRLIEGDRDFAEKNEDLQFYSSTKTMIGISADNNREFLRKYAGCYKCIRLTTNSSEILVTHMRVIARHGNIPEFRHVEVIPDEAKGLQGRERRVIWHRGFVFSKFRRVIFLSSERTLRQLSCVISSNPGTPTFTGVLLAFEAINTLPFACRVFITKTEEIADDDVLTDPNYGIFETTDARYEPYMKYITNDVATNDVLMTITGI